MSKIIEALKASSKDPVRKESPSPSSRKETPVLKEFSIEKSGYDLTQEELANIYFSATGKSKKSAEPPVIIRVVEKPRFASVIPWIIASIAFLITALSLFSTKRIFIDVKVVDDNFNYSKGAPLEPLDRAAEKAPEAASQTSPAIHKITLQSFTFEGAAYLKSSRDQNLLTLVNSSVAPFARAVLHFDEPLDLSQAKVVFFAKGNKGGENLAFALKDKENRQAFYKGKIYPFPNNLTTSWQKAEVSLVGVTHGFDSHNVTSLRFEFGSKDTDNKSGDTIFIKDLYWVTE